MQGAQLFIGALNFWEAARADIADAKLRVLVQAMTFEGDAAGLPVAQGIGLSTAIDRRVLVDDYTRHVINDTFLALSSDPALVAEAEATWAMFDGLAAAGAGVRVTNPVGCNPLAYATRNHKKLLVMDDTVWIGGINFSDHNFAWHDMMVRVEDKAVSDWFASRFELDWQGAPAAGWASLGGMDLLDLDGADNERAFAPLLDRFRQARRSVEVISAYPTFPFVSAMAEAAARGVPVTIYTPRPNNKPVIRDYLLRVARRTPIAIRLLPEMTHVKAALIDGETLVFGTSNFDFVSNRANAEYVVTATESALIADFEARLFGPARSGSKLPDPADHSAWRGLRATIGLRAADVLIHGLRQPRRVTQWQRPD